MCVAYFLKFSVGTVNFRAYAYLWEQFEGGNKTRVGTINITTILHSYAHCTPSRFVWTNVKSALDDDNSCAVQLSNRTTCRLRFQQIRLHIEVLLAQLNNWAWSHAHQDNRAHAWCGDYSRVGFILFSSSQITSAGTIQGGENSGNTVTHTCKSPDLEI